MPSIVGNLKINTVGSGGIVNIGDSFFLSPKSTSKTFAGSGSFITGDFIRSANGISTTNTFEPHAADSNVAGTT